MAWQAAALSQAIEFGKSRSSNVDEFITSGRDLLRSFPSSERSPFLNYCRWQLCRAVGDEEAAWESVRRAGRHGFYCFITAAECLQRYETTQGAVDAFDDAMSAHDEHDEYLRIARAFLVHDSPHGANEVRGLLDGLATHKQGLVRQFALMALCLAGNLEYVKTLAGKGEFGDQGERFAEGECLRFLADPTPDSERRLMREIGPHAYASINAHFAVAMSRMADGDRPDAVDHLTQCTHTVAVGNLSYEMARAMLHRMQSDPDWPRWLTDRSAK